MGIGSIVSGNVFAGGSSLSIAPSGSTSLARTALSNEQLIFKAADIADRRSSLLGHVAGTKKHSYAEQLLRRYQRRYGDRGLEFEQSFSAGTRANYGDRGSIRADVFDFSNNKVYDWKFGSATLNQTRANHLRQNLPASVKNVIGYNPRFGSTVY